ncbi:MAG TPA: class I SAM-dependent methyltransferase [Solirubrobacterales bacterium]|nr:class I SAM-dependent methyltransferase [Solirubrobacterales bacterium]
MSEAAYDRMGVGYRQVRRPDPRIAAAIEAALGGAESVLNVGAGTGSYEPAGRAVTAVEPSRVMIEQRPPGAAPVVQASAEALPFGDDEFDAAMALITVHHWADVGAGLAEMRRVARGPVVVLSFDPTVLRGLWFCDYFPGAVRFHEESMPTLEWLAALLGPGATIAPVPVPSQCSDGFFCAIWDRPELHLDPEVRQGSSVWHVIGPEETERGLTALRADLESGTWDERHGELRTLPELDVGLRLLSSG